MPLPFLCQFCFQRLVKTSDYIAFNVMSYQLFSLALQRCDNSHNVCVGLALLIFILCSSAVMLWPRTLPHSCIVHVPLRSKILNEPEKSLSLHPSVSYLLKWWVRSQQGLCFVTVQHLPKRGSCPSREIQGAKLVQYWCQQPKWEES